MTCVRSWICQVIGKIVCESSGSEEGARRPVRLVKSVGVLPRPETQACDSLMVGPLQERLENKVLPDTDAAGV